MAKRITIGSRSVAVAVLAEAIREALPGQYEAEILDGRGELTETLADRLVTIAWDVEYKARAEKLVITIDAGVSTPDAARSTPETADPAQDALNAIVPIPEG